MSSKRKAALPRSKRKAAAKPTKSLETPQVVKPDNDKSRAAARLSIKDKFIRRSDTEAPRRLPGVRYISRESIAILWRHKGLFFGVTALFAVLNLALVRGFSGATDLTPLRELLSGEYPGGIGQFTTSLTLFALLVSASGANSTEVAGAYQTFLAIIFSLAVIWLLRQVMAGENNLRIRDGFYKGMYPLIPVILVLLVIVLQLVPLIIGAGIYGLVVSNGIAVNFIEQLLWSSTFFTGLVISLYLLASSIFAAYIATLPDMTPMKALRSARDLVRYRRWAVLRKLLFLPFALLIVSALVMVPIILVITPVAPWAFFILSMFGLVVIHAYLYVLYRELLV